MKIYVDFDGVIFDSEKLLFEEYKKFKNQSESLKIKYIQEKDWEELLSKCNVINNGIEILKSLRKDISILTKVFSMENEGVAKIKILRSMGIYNAVKEGTWQQMEEELMKVTEGVAAINIIGSGGCWI